MAETKFIITGGNRLNGRVRVSGAKNSVLKLMAASLLTPDECIISNVPNITDVQIMMQVLRTLGAEVEWEADHLRIRPGDLKSRKAPYHLVRRMRASIAVLGPLLARYGEAMVAIPGGCNIGSRKIDMHLKGLVELGAEITSEHGYVTARGSNLKGAHIILDFPSVGATENLMMAAVKADGNTTIENAAREPEIQDLAAFLGSMGAGISGAGSPIVEIEGNADLHGTSHASVGDRIEAGTIAIAAAVTSGDVEITGINPSHLGLPLEKLREIGVEVEENRDGMHIKGNGDYRSVDLATLPFPGFPTDLQPQIMVLLSLAPGAGIVTENVFESRFMFVDELNRMGCDITIEGHHAVVKGDGPLSGAEVCATDLRAGAALVLAGLAAQGQTDLLDIHHIDRGYEKFEEKLSGLGADIRRAAVDEGEEF
ncbi:MAG: UDP-N-acetylglucosamine 1-carboxyvinyltransferase [Candidatus Solincola sediminis]|uniref:UDP-N-acetylglucosamine 1-carboxyvinyltransferase n=1 Tax=Candidatus Solincola sediminis TaxID=1797199 RepID=A0A1F2WQ71_9ACTN|nr:MAG: UDP-N-acetylglucosamine 1-carboxyvinyltransferase [Candidatus Solincola sediminis]OFW61471.1 MAG: UDP-N-acetylglucosamine 1-carboxyvinyltransferase [Candidatus Solincola sediminis]